MSKVSTIHAAYLTLIGAQLTNHVRLPNPYKAEDNAAIFVKCGYGLRLGTARNTDRCLGDMQSVRRTFTVVLTREYLAREDDSAAKATTELQILEDALLLEKAIEKDPTIGGAANVTNWIGDTGIEYVNNDTDRFLKTEIQFESEYFEILT